MAAANARFRTDRRLLSANRYCRSSSITEQWGSETLASERRWLLQQGIPLTKQTHADFFRPYSSKLRQRLTFAAPLVCNYDTTPFAALARERVKFSCSRGTVTLAKSLDSWARYVCQRQRSLGGVARWFSLLSVIAWLMDHVRDRREMTWARKFDVDPFASAAVYSCSVSVSNSL